MDPSLFRDLMILLGAYAASVGLSLAVRKLLVKEALLDHPNERSMHTLPVPRGGGLALMAVLIPCMILAALSLDSLPTDGWLIIGTAILVAISWQDDRRGSSPVVRLVLHFLAVIIGTMAFGSHALLLGGILPFWLDRLLMIVGWAWFINLYNFMDGIDGLTGVETIFIAAGVCLVGSEAAIGGPFSALLCTLISGACLGFLVVNWYPAKIFLGDVGSVPCGYLAGYLLILLAIKGQWAAPIILSLYYIADSGLTLTTRIVRGEKFWQPHRSHFYQQATQAVGRHDRVVAWIMVTDLALLVTAMFSVFFPWVCLAIAGLIVAILLYKMHKVTVLSG